MRLPLYVFPNPVFPKYAVQAIETDNRYVFYYVIKDTATDEVITIEQVVFKSSLTPE